MPYNRCVSPKVEPKRKSCMWIFLSILREQERGVEKKTGKQEKALLECVIKLTGLGQLVLHPQALLENLLNISQNGTTLVR